MGNSLPVDSLSGDGAAVADPDALAVLRLELDITDPESVNALRAVPEGRARHELARRALRIGVLALEQARGRVDAEALRNEGERLMGALDASLADYRRQTETLLAGTLGSYFFDPASGRFNERVDRLVRQDGELERVMRTQIERHQREVGDVLAKFVGEESALHRLLAPDDSNRFLTAMRERLDALLGERSGQILREFSLDVPESALSRLVRELRERHGELTGELGRQIQSVVGELSLDEENSALSRLVRQVETAQQRIANEFSLDAQDSALARLKRELLGVLDADRIRSERFHAEVKAALEAAQARKQEAARSTTHGHAFEEAAFGAVQALCGGAGDIAERVGAVAGAVPRCKVGDCVVVLGADCAAAGAHIVLEFKEDASYTLASTLKELEEARKNRSAAVSVMVHSKRTAPAGVPDLLREGNDVVAVWDAEDEGSDVVLRAALMLAKALCVRAAAQAQGEARELREIEGAVRAIEQQLAKFGEIRKKAETIRNATDAIVQSAEMGERQIRRQVAELDEHLAAFRTGEPRTVASD